MTSRVDITPIAGRDSGQEFAEVRYASAHSRLLIWKETLDLLPGAWFLGHGPERFESVFVSESPSGRAWKEQGMIVDDPHNVFLGQLFATGVIGLAAWLGVLVAFCATCARTLARSGSRFDQSWIAALLASVVAYLAQAQFTPDVVVTTFLFWLGISLGGATARVDRSRE